MARKVMDCRDLPNKVGCTLTIAGEEDEVVKAAIQHAVTVHGEKDSAELRKFVKENLKSEPEDFESEGAPA